eukprot:scaffold73385_cov31-Tisochrysis_lutea.AAC.4
MAASSSAGVAGDATVRAAASSVRASASMMRGLERSHASAVHSSRSGVVCEGAASDLPGDLKPRFTLTHACRE